MPTPNQLSRYYQSQLPNRSNIETVYFWEGFSGNLGLVKSASGDILPGVISGNEIPGYGDQVEYIPGIPWGQIFVRRFAPRRVQVPVAGEDFLLILASVSTKAWLIGPSFGTGLELSPTLSSPIQHAAIAGNNKKKWAVVIGDSSNILQVITGQNGSETATGTIDVDKTIESIAMPGYGYLQIRATADGQQYLYHCRINADATVDLLAENNTILAIGPGFYLVSFSYSFTRVSYNRFTNTCTFESLSASAVNSEQFLVPPIGDPYLVGSGTPTSPCGLPYRSVRILLPHAGGINALTILINNQGITMDSWAVSSIVFDRPE